MELTKRPRPPPVKLCVKIPAIRLTSGKRQDKVRCAILPCLFICKEKHLFYFTSQTVRFETIKQVFSWLKRKENY